jgi:RNA polymerase sigma-70 factor (ECF subfamily)
MSAAEPLMRDRDLVAAAQAGDEDAWHELFSEYYPKLYGFMRSRVSDPDTAEDLAADAFVDAFRGLPRFRWRGKPFGAWLFKVARNRLRMHYRAKGRDEVPIWDGAATTGDGTVSIDVRDALSRLKPEYREAIELRYLVGLSGAEAAAATGRSHGAFRTLLHRATKEFKAEYGLD